MRTERLARVPPVDPVQHIGELRGRNRHHAVGRRRPDEAPFLQALGVERHAQPVMPDDLDHVAPAPPEDEKITSMGIALQRLLHLQRQAVHAAPHVGAAHCQPDADIARNRDHRRSSTSRTRRKAPASTSLSTRTNRPSPSSISIKPRRGAGSGVTGATAADGVTSTGSSTGAPCGPSWTSRARRRQ
uniref:Uncharacterized protein n=1 Tax=Magnetospirillum gryphiswaldense TaxID=55518 RepID=Q3BK80_9PROT|nr:hypothetical protein mgI544 [Magnetospirillum gryphiswaldense MSR-1]